MRPLVRASEMLLVAAILVVGAAGHSRADDDGAKDHELARQALIEGRIRPLAEITEKFKAAMAGEILGVELESEVPGTFNYEFKVLTPEGQLKEVDVDAKTGEIRSIEDDD